MALQHPLSLDNGIELQAAYSRISSIHHTHGETVVNVDTYSSAASRQAGKPTVRQASYSLPWTDGVSLTGAYTALKLQDGFANSLDV